MKRTKSMVYMPTEGSTELFIVATNDSRLYKNTVIPCVRSLHKKYLKGIYEPDKAVNIWYGMATEASSQHRKDFGYGFTVRERFTAAVDMERYYRENVIAGDL